MRKLTESSRFIAIIAVLTLLVMALATMLWSVYKAGLTIIALVTGQGTSAEIVLMLIQLFDNFLIAIAFHIFAVSIYELFIGELSVPAWMKIDDLHDLKTRLGSILVLVMAVKFLEKLAEWKDAQETLYFALSITLVSAVLIAFGIFRDKE